MNGSKSSTVKNLCVTSTLQWGHIMTQKTQSGRNGVDPGLQHTLPTKTMHASKPRALARGGRHQRKDALRLGSPSCRLNSLPDGTVCLDVCWAECTTELSPSESLFLCHLILFLTSSAHPSLSHPWPSANAKEFKVTVNSHPQPTTKSKM